MTSVIALKSELKAYQKQLRGAKACVAMFLPGLGPDMVNYIGGPGSGRLQIGNVAEREGVTKSMFQSEAVSTQHVLNDTMVPGCRVVASDGATNDGMDLVPRPGLTGPVLGAPSGLGAGWVGLIYLPVNNERGRHVSWGDGATTGDANPRQMYSLNRGQRRNYGATMNDGITEGAITGQGGPEAPAAYVYAASLNIRTRQLKYVINSLDPDSSILSATFDNVSLDRLPTAFDTIRLRENLQGGRTALGDGGDPEVPFPWGMGDHYFFNVPILERNFLPYADTALKGIAAEPDTPIALEARA